MRTLSLAGAILIAGLAGAQSAKPRLAMQFGDDTRLKVTLSEDGKRLATGGSGNAPAVRLYDTPTGRLIRSSIGHTGTIDRVAFSPDGTMIASLSDDRSLRLWSVKSGAELHRTVSEDFFDEAHFGWSADSRYLMYATSHHQDGSDHTFVHVIEAAKWSEIGSYRVRDPGLLEGAVFSADGKSIFIADATAKGNGAEVVQLALPGMTPMRSVSPLPYLWDIRPSADGRFVYALHHPQDDYVLLKIDFITGKEIWSRSIKADHLVSVGKRVWTLAIDHGLCEWRDAETNSLIASLHVPDVVGDWSVSADGRTIAIAGDDSVYSFDAPSGRQISVTRGLTSPVMSFGNMESGGIALATEAGKLPIWNLASGQPQVSLEGKASELESSVFSPKQRLIVTGGETNQLTFWNADSGKPVRHVTLVGGCIDLCVSQDQRWLAVATRDLNPLNRPAGSPSGDEAVVIDLDKGTIVHRYAGSNFAFVRFSPNSRLLAFSDGRRVRVAEAGTWVERANVGSKERPVDLFAFTPSSDELWCTTGNGYIIRYSFPQSQMMPEFKIADDNLGSICFLGKGQRFVTYVLFGKLAEYDSATHAMIGEFERPPAPVVPLEVSPNGKFLLGGDMEGAAQIWSLKTRKRVGSFMAFKDGTWAAVDPTGRYDASNGGQVNGLYWLIDDHPVALSQFKRFYYDPHLLAKILELDPEKPRDVPDLTGVALCPDVSVTLDAKTKKATVTLTDQGGGIGPTKLYLNGVNIETLPAPSAAAHTFRFTVDVSAPIIAGRLLPTTRGEAANRLEVIAYDKGSILSSRAGQGVDLNSAGLTAPPSQLFALVVGEDYIGSNRRLRYPGADARAFSNGLELAAANLLGKERVHVTRLIGDDASPSFPHPTKPNLLNAMNEIAARAKATDIVVIYFSGHGLGRAAGKSGYFFLTGEGGDADAENDPAAAKYTLSSAELAAWLQTKVLAGKRGIVLDTCAAGAAAPDLTAARAVPRDLELAWEQLKDNAGLYVLAGCASDKVSYEATNVGHGLLTYSLLEAIDQAKPDALGSHGFLDIDRWFGYAETRVRELLDQLGIRGVQQPEERAQANARDYPVGLVDPSVEGKLNLPLPGPVLILDTFRNSDTDDPLELTDAVEAALNGRARGGGSMSYWSGVKRHPKALQLRGTYAVTGASVKVTVRIMRFVGPDLRSQTMDTFTVDGEASKPKDLAIAIVTAVQAHVPNDWKLLQEGS